MSDDEARDRQVPADSSSVCIVLVHTRNPLNIGAAARAMGNFGFDDLRVVEPHELAFREARSAVGVSSIIANARQFDDLRDAISDCTLVLGTTAATRRSPAEPVLSLQQCPEVVRKHNGRIALLFGSEKRGLSNAELSYCQYVVRIPTAPEQPSMNLGQAVAVCLYELSRQRALTGAGEPTRLAPARQLELLTEIMAGSLHRNGYMTDEAVRATEEKIRRLMRRLLISPEDAELLLGIVRHLTRTR